MIGGWIDREAYGCLGQGTVNPYAGRSALGALHREDGLLVDAPRNFGRFTRQAQEVCYATALALGDAGLADASESQRKRIGLLACFKEGCLEANLRYFEDYVEAGRTLARANLFVYTLPSSPLAEAAIHFGLGGPLMDVSANGESYLEVGDVAAELLGADEADAMLVFLSDDAGTVALYGDSASTLREALGRIPADAGSPVRHLLQAARG